MRNQIFIRWMTGLILLGTSMALLGGILWHRCLELRKDVVAKKASTGSERVGHMNPFPKRYYTYQDEVGRRYMKELPLLTITDLDGTVAIEYLRSNPNESWL